MNNLNTMDLKIIELKESIYRENDKRAQLVKDELKAKKTFLLNLMSAPGSGKTTTLLALNKALKGRVQMGVLEADIDSDVDAKTMLENGIPSVQLHTGGMCHLDADMTKQGLDALNRYDLDLIVLENIGNLVCPAEFDTGAQLNATILSVPEGDDKPTKYPLMYEVSDLLIINKIDVLDYFDFDFKAVEEVAKKRNPKVTVFPVSAKKEDGMEALADYIVKAVKAWQEEV